MGHWTEILSVITVFLLHFLKEKNRNLRLTFYPIKPGLPGKVGLHIGRYAMCVISFFKRAGKMRNKAFTLVELIIVVTILGIMAAIVIPTFQGNVATAKESASKTNLMTIRTQIELYKLQHNGYPPGYVAGAGAPVGTVSLQLIGTTMVDGTASPSTVPSAPFLYGPYLKSIPKNSFNNLSTIVYVAEATAFSDAVDGTSSGWLYKKETGEIAMNMTGADSEGVNYYDY